MQHQKKGINKIIVIVDKSFVVDKKCTQKAANNAVFKGSLKKTEHINKE